MLKSPLLPLSGVYFTRYAVYIKRVLRVIPQKYEKILKNVLTLGNMRGIIQALNKQV
jgi:hypothetical protein